MDRLRQDIRVAIRTLLKSPLITIAALISLGLGIGANATIFSAVDVFMIRPLAFEDADRVVVVWTTDPERGWQTSSSSVPDYLDWRALARSVDLAAWGGGGVDLSLGDRPERLEARRVATSFFDVLRKRPVLGRGFTLEEESASGPAVVILGDGLWRRAFGADPGVIGRAVNLDGRPHEIVGVMPARVGFGRDPDVWLPSGFTGEEARSSRFLNVIGRIRDGYDLDAARTELNAIQARLASEHPATNAGQGANVLRLQDEWFDEGFRQGSLIASTAVLFVLLIACANVANLLLARAAAREREIALRGALGAGRIRIIRQLLTESLILAAGGGVLGVLLSIAGVRWLRGLFPPFLAGVEGVALNGRVLAFTAAITLLAGIAFGLAPAMRSARLNLRDLLTDANRGNTGSRGGRLRNALVIAEISLSLVLLVSSALLVQAFVKLRTTDPGFRVDEVVTAAVTLPASRYPDAAAVTTFQSTMLERVAALPGVRSVGGTSLLPMRGNSGRYYAVPGEPPPEPGREPIVSVRTVTPGYFEAMDVRLVAGRIFDAGERADAPAVVVINELMAARHWPGGNAVGQRLTFADRDHEVVGVVEDTRDFGPDDEPGRMVYFSAFQTESRTLRLVVHTELPPDRLADAIRSAVRDLDPEQPLYSLQTLRDILQDDISGSLAMTKVLGGLAVIAFLLAAVGVYGVMAYSVAQRTVEMGIRMALGAQRQSVFALVLRRGALVTGLGIAIGLVIALSVTRLLSFFLFGVSPFSPIAFTAVPLLLAVTGLVATWVPAVRATRVDPMLALRSE